jgi:hypothetical protein
MFDSHTRFAEYLDLATRQRQLEEELHAAQGGKTRHVGTPLG